MLVGRARLSLPLESIREWRSAVARAGRLGSARQRGIGKYGWAATVAAAYDELKFIATGRFGLTSAPASSFRVVESTAALRPTSPSPSTVKETLP